MAELGDYLELAPAGALAQFRELGRRRPVPTGQRQVVFLPVETLLCLAASYVVEHSRFGSSSAPRAPEPVQSLARLFRRPPSSVLAKMANLDGTRSHGARWDQIAGRVLRDDPERFTELYRTVLAAARAAGVDTARLTDFLGLEHGGQLVMLGQEELEASEIERDLESRLRRHPRGRSADGDWSARDERETERIMAGAIRVGQHRFAAGVLGNCGHRCVFCGFAPPATKIGRMLVASHIKPWRHSSNAERRDHRNGLAACPTHDVAFDTGLLTVDGDLRIERAPVLDRAVESGDVTRYYFDRPPLRDRLTLPEGAQAPGEQYLRWHQREIFARRGAGG